LVCYFSKKIQIIFFKRKCKEENSYVIVLKIDSIAGRYCPFKIVLLLKKKNSAEVIEDVKNLTKRLVLLKLYTRFQKEKLQIFGQTTTQHLACTMHRVFLRILWVTELRFF
jgi:hypothetical protein